jgi:hypothetical protein
MLVPQFFITFLFASGVLSAAIGQQTGADLNRERSLEDDIIKWLDKK